MAASLRYEFKRILLPLCIFSVIAVAIFAVAALSSRLVYVNSYDGADVMRPASSLLSVPTVILVLLCFIVPAMQFSYRMNRHSIDLWYSMPVRRETMLAVRMIGGAVLAVVPYTLSLFIGTAIIAMRENVFIMYYYPLSFLAMLPYGIMLYLINIFLFTRANTVRDGIIFMLAGTFIQTMPFVFLESLYFEPFDKVNWDAGNFMTIGPLVILTSLFSEAIRGNEFIDPNMWICLTLIAAEGVAAGFGIIYTAKSHVAENAGQVSDSLFGYRVYIPFYVFFGIISSAAITGSLTSLFGILNYLDYIIYLVCGAAAYFIFRRSFRLKKEDLIVLFSSWGAAVIISVIVAIPYIVALQ